MGAYSMVDRPPENVQRREVDHRWWETIPGVDRPPEKVLHTRGGDHRWWETVTGSDRPLLKRIRDGVVTTAGGSLFQGWIGLLKRFTHGEVTTAGERLLQGRIGHSWKGSGTGRWPPLEGAFSWSPVSWGKRRICVPSSCKRIWQSRVDAPLPKQIC
jgi:hypothetical protein